MRQSPLPHEVIKELHQHLERRHGELVHQLREQLLELDDVRGPEGEHEIRDSLDAASVVTMAEIRLADTRREEQEIRDINAALNRMHRGTYGLCSNCGEPIPEDRLRAYPTATRCRECQELKERIPNF